MSHDHKLMVIDERVANMLNAPNGFAPETMMKIVRMNQEYDQIKADKQKEEEEIDSFVYRDVMYADTKKKKATSTSTPSAPAHPDGEEVEIKMPGGTTEKHVVYKVPNPPHPEKTKQALGHLADPLSPIEPHIVDKCDHKWRLVSVGQYLCEKCNDRMTDH